MPTSRNNELQTHRQAMKDLMQHDELEGLFFRAAQQNAYAKMGMATTDDQAVRQLVALITEAAYSDSSPADYIERVQYQYVELLMQGVAPTDLLAAEGELADDDAVNTYRIMLPGL